MKKQYITSERSHLMCPNTHFGILIDIKAPYDNNKIDASLDALSFAHPFLRSVIEYEQGTSQLYYKIKEQSQICVLKKDKQQTVWEDYEEISEQAWNVFKDGLLKVFFYSSENRLRALFVAHHLLGDGRSILGLACEFANHYAKDITPNYVEESLIQNMNDLPANCNLTGTNKLLIRYLNYKWKKENSHVSYNDYAIFAKKFARENPTCYEHHPINAADISQIKSICKKNDITINDFLVAKLLCASNMLQIGIAIDIRDKLSCYNAGSLGNFASATRITMRNKSKDFLATAKKVHMQVNQLKGNNQKLMLLLSLFLNLNQTLIDATAISSLGEFKSKTAKFVGSNILGFSQHKDISVTNLGRINSECIAQTVFIPPISNASLYTLGVVTTNGTMQLCSSFYKMVISNDEVKKQLHGFLK